MPQYWRVEKLHASLGEVTDACAALPPRHIAKFLVHVFFKHAAVNYFYVEQAWLVEKLNQIYETPSDLRAKDAATLAMVLNIFAIGTQYAHLESPTKTDTAPDDNNEWEDEIGTMFYRQATKLLPEVIHLASLESVQACLLFGLYALPIDASGLGYIYLNLAIKLAMQNGMHRRLPRHTFAPETMEARVRVWWTAYCTERLAGQLVAVQC